MTEIANKNFMETLQNMTPEQKTIENSSIATLDEEINSSTPSGLTITNSAMMNLLLDNKEVETASAETVDNPTNLTENDAVDFIMEIIDYLENSKVIDYLENRASVVSALKTYINSSGKPAIKYGNARNIARSMVNTLVRRTNMQNISELLDLYDNEDDFREDYDEILKDISKDYDISDEDYEIVDTAIYDILNDQTMWK